MFITSSRSPLRRTKRRFKLKRSSLQASKMNSTDQAKPELPSKAFGRNSIRKNNNSNSGSLSKSSAQQQQQQQQYESTSTTTTDPLLLKRDRAQLALHSTLQMDMSVAMKLLDQFPQLYQDIPSLATRILYLHQELSLPKQKICNFLESKPSMMVNILLVDDLQDTLKSTVELVQTELPCLSAHDIVKYKLWRLDRIALSSKLRLLKGRLGMSSDDICCMIRRSSVLLNQDLQRLTARMQYLVDGPVGRALGCITRRGVSVRSITSPNEQRNLVLSRIQDLYRKYPDVVATPGLEGTVAFLLDKLQCTDEQLGKIIYRRPQLLQYDVDTLQDKLQYFANKLGLPLCCPNTVSSSVGAASTTSTTMQSSKRTVVHLLALMPDIFTQSIPSNLEPKFVFFQNELGMTQDDLQEMIVERPQILSLSLQGNIRPKVDYLLGPQVGMSRDDLKRLLVAHPQSLRESLRDRIQPRCQEVVVKRGLKIAADVPLNVFVMTELQWNAWVEADFDATELSKWRLRNRHK